MKCFLPDQKPTLLDMQTIYGALAEGFALFKSEKIKIELGEMSIRQAFIQVKSRSLNENVKEWFSIFMQTYTYPKKWG